MYRKEHAKVEWATHSGCEQMVPKVPRSLDIFFFLACVCWFVVAHLMIFVPHSNLARVRKFVAPISHGSGTPFRVSSSYVVAQWLRWIRCSRCSMTLQIANMENVRVLATPHHAASQELLGRQGGGHMTDMRGLGARPRGGGQVRRMDGQPHGVHQGHSS